MLTYRLVRLIETHSNTLAENLLHKIQKSDLTRAYSRVPLDELKRRVGEIYLHLGEWLTSKSDSDIDSHYIISGFAPQYAKGSVFPNSFAPALQPCVQLWSRPCRSRSQTGFVGIARSRSIRAHGADRQYWTRNQS